MAPTQILIIQFNLTVAILSMQNNYNELALFWQNEKWGQTGPKTGISEYLLKKSKCLHIYKQQEFQNIYLQSSAYTFVIKILRPKARISEYLLKVKMPIICFQNAYYIWNYYK